MHPPVLSKVDFVRRYAAGEFGNASPTWDTLSDFERRAPHSGRYHIRNRVAGGQTWYDVPWNQVYFKWRTLIKVGVRPLSLYISAMAPTEKTLIQGEVQQGIWGPELYYSTIAKPMRDALREEAHQVIGIVAILLLQTYLCPKSQEWLEYLLREYPDHVVEFSTYSVEWGTVPGFNSVWWEVRKY